MGRRIIRQSQILGWNSIINPDNYDFPENAFPPLSDRLELWNMRNELGRYKCLNSTVGIIGCARDIQEKLFRSIHQIERLGNLFLDYRIFIYESDSVDGTPDILRQWSENNPKVFYKSEKLGLPRLYDLSRSRFEIMAQIRNKTADFAQEHFSNFDFIIVLDMDLRGGFSQNGVLNSFGYSGWWDVITANGLDLQAQYYYDMAVFYEKGDFSESCIEQRSGSNYASIKSGFQRPRYDCGELPFAIGSGFGGLAIYKNSAFKESRYSAELCDHASFHKLLWEKGFNRIFVNPSMIVIR